MTLQSCFFALGLKCIYAFYQEPWEYCVRTRQGFHGLFMYKKEIKMIKTDTILEFDKIRNRLMELSHTECAKALFENMTPYLEESEVLARLRETTEAKQMIEEYGNPPIATMSEIKNMMKSAEKGECLSAQQLEQVALMLTAVKRLKDYLNRCKLLTLSLPYYEENLDFLEEIREELNEKIRGGRVDDYATPTLKNLRNKIEQTETKMRDKADLVMRSNKEWMSDHFSTTRNGRICLPVKKEYKFKINGTVVDKSSTGSTLFMEPVSVGKYFEELQELKMDEENEVRKILYTLTVAISDRQDILCRNWQTVEKLDFIFAKAKISLEYEGTEPKIHTERWIRLVNGRHPLMEKEKNVPLNFEIGNGINGIVITGPNTGGKTVAIKTVAMNCLMAQCGLHVPCEYAEICMNNQVLCDIGDGQNITENLSTFSSHIRNVLEILKRADKESLVIIDELGSGTDPTEGMGIAIAILEELKKSECLYLVTTHYPEVKQYAEEKEGVTNARMAFDQESLEPLFQMIIGEAGESCAFHIARRLGMPGTMLERASIAAYGKSIDFVLQKEASAEGIGHEHTASIKKRKVWNHDRSYMEQYRLGDSVMVFPDEKIGIVCETVNEKGVLRVQLKDKKVWINHTRVKLQVAADQLYPPDYDFSIIFDSVEMRKARHKMARKYVESEVLEYLE